MDLTDNLRSGDLIALGDLGVETAEAGVGDFAHQGASWSTLDILLGGGRGGCWSGDITGDTSNATRLVGAEASLPNSSSMSTVPPMNGPLRLKDIQIGRNVQ